jgi:hypothetical protein
LWGWKQHQGSVGIILTIILPILVAIIWGTFAVPNDPSRSGKAPVAVPGFIRLIIELSIFSIAVLFLIDIGYKTSGLIYGIIVIFHYLSSYDRLLWLIRPK